MKVHHQHRLMGCPVKLELFMVQRLRDQTLVGHEPINIQYISGMHNLLGCWSKGPMSKGLRFKPWLGQNSGMQSFWECGTRILKTACEVGLSLISLVLSQCMSHLGLNTNI